MNVFHIQKFLLLATILLSDEPLEIKTSCSIKDFFETLHIPLLFCLFLIHFVKMEEVKIPFSAYSLVSICS